MLADSKFIDGSASRSRCSGRTVAQPPAPHSASASAQPVQRRHDRLEEDGETRTELLLRNAAVVFEEHVRARFDPEGEAIAKADAQADARAQGGQAAGLEQKGVGVRAAQGDAALQR